MKQLMCALQVTMSNLPMQSATTSVSTNQFTRLMGSDSEDKSVDLSVIIEDDYNGSMEEGDNHNEVLVQNNQNVIDYSILINSTNSTAAIQQNRKKLVAFHPKLETPFPRQILTTILKTYKMNRTKSESNNYMVTDSGATVHMDNDITLFEYHVPITDEQGDPVYITQGDGTPLLVPSMGLVHKQINGKHTIRYMSYYVPELGVPVYAVKQHIQSKGCYFHSKNNTAMLAFPQFIVKCSPLAFAPVALMDAHKSAFCVSSFT